MNTLVCLEKYECPICDKKHNVEKHIYKSNVVIKGEKIEYEEYCYKCNNVSGENEFFSSELMNKNLKNARNAYRKKFGLLTSDDIVNARNKYGLSQSDFSLLLGFGEITINRYETKMIQEKAHDNLIRLINDDYLFALKCLEENKDKFVLNNYKKIKSIINNLIEKESKIYYKAKEILSQYISYSEPNEYNGYKLLDLSKLSNVIGYIASKYNNLYKVKLMKFLWYIDMIYYKKYNISLTGLVYIHMPLGALPIAYDEIIYLPNIVVEPEVDLYGEKIVYRIINNTEKKIENITKNEKEVIDKVLDKFKNENTKNIVTYMHNENAYINTKMKQAMSYKFADNLNEF